MYIIYKNGKRFGKQSFFNYEDARSYVRNHIRTKVGYTGNDWSFTVHSNPAITKYGFTIKYSPKVNPWKSFKLAF